MSDRALNGAPSPHPVMDSYLLWYAKDRRTGFGL